MASPPKLPLHSSFLDGPTRDRGGYNKSGTPRVSSKSAMRAAIRGGGVGVFDHKPHHTRYGLSGTSDNPRDASGRGSRLAGLKAGREHARKLGAIGIRPPNKPNGPILGSGRNAAAITGEKHAFRYGNAGRGKGGGIHHRPSGTPRGGQFF